MMWPFKYVNGVQTPESVTLETAKQPPPLTQWEICQQTNPEDALL
jgi:hypothetical protein